VFEDASDSVADVPSHNTNQEVLNYFSRMTNHYLHLVRSSYAPCPRHHTKFPIIAVSGANLHMFKEKEFFTSLRPAQGQVILGDGSTTLDIHGIGTVTCKVGDHRLVIEDVRYVPGLGESIYSLFLHIQTPGHRLHSSFEDGLEIIFPNFTTKAILGHHDIYLNALPVNEGTADESLSTENTDVFCRNLKKFTDDVTKETKYLDHLLKNLRQYYKEIKTKRQLNLNVPAGFRQDKQSNLERRGYKSSNAQSFSDTGSIGDDIHLLSSLSPDPDLQSHHQHYPTVDTPSRCNPPILRCIDKASSSLPSKIMFTEDSIRSSVGFRRIDTIKAHLADLYQPTVSLNNLPEDAVLDVGHVTTLPKKPRTTNPVPRPAAFLDVVHVDIVLSPEVSLGNVHYGLLFSDRYSRMSYIYPLRNLTADICKQLEAFFAHLGTTPKRLISDFDMKLIGGKAREYLNSLMIHVNAAPAHRQDKNGLVERHWQTIVAMARNWLASIKFLVLCSKESLRSVQLFSFTVRGWTMDYTSHVSIQYPT